MKKLARKYIELQVITSVTSSYMYVEKLLLRKNTNISTVKFLPAHVYFPYSSLLWNF